MITLLTLLVPEIDLSLTLKIITHIGVGIVFSRICLFVCLSAF